MALLSAGKIGNTAVSTVIDAQLNNFFYYENDYYKSFVASNVPREHIYKIYSNAVDISPKIREANQGDIVPVINLPNGKYLAVYIKTKARSKDNRFDFFYDYVNVAFRVYNSDGTYSEPIKEGVTASATYYTDIVMKSGSVSNYPLPWFVQFIYDEEKKQGALSFVLVANYDNQTLSYSENNGCYYFRITMSNWNLTKQFEEFGGYAKEYDTDPWSNAGYSGIGGGDGNFDFTSDNVGLPSIPAIDSVSTGFLQLFAGSISNIVSLSKYMWSTEFFDSIVKITSNPIDIIMGLYMYPFIVSASQTKYIRAGNVITDIKMGVPDSQIIEIDCGSVPVPSFYGAYLDFEPFSKCEIYLPYCGTFNLSMDDISGKEVNVKYRIDLLTGVCVAYVIVNGTVKYNFTGSCAINIPISSRSFENLYNSIIGLVGNMFSGSSVGLPSVGSVAGAVSAGKNQIQHGGIASGNSGYLGVQNPYFIFNIPRVAIPKGLNKYTGYPIFATYVLSDLKGYTEIEEIHLENMGQATKEEIDKIISLLKGGVIL